MTYSHALKVTEGDLGRQQRQLSTDPFPQTIDFSNRRGRLPWRAYYAALVCHVDLARLRVLLTPGGRLSRVPLRRPLPTALKTWTLHKGGQLAIDIMTLF
jgi:hypothetical protein